MAEAQEQQETTTWPLEKRKKPFENLHPLAFAMESESTTDFETFDKNAQIVFKLEKIPPNVTLAFQYRKNPNLYRTLVVEIKRKERRPYLIYAELPNRKFEGMVNPVEDNTLVVSQWNEVNLREDKEERRFISQEKPLIVTIEDAKSLAVEIVQRKMPLGFRNLQDHG